MKLPSFKLINSSDFKADFKEMIETLLLSLNSGIEVLYDTLNNRVTLRDNISCTVKDVDVEVNSSGIPKDSTIIKTDLKTKVEGTQVIMALNRTNSANYVSTQGGPFLSYEVIQDGIKVNHIAGLVANNKYNLRVVIYQQ